MKVASLRVTRHCALPLLQVIHNADGSTTVSDLTIVDISQVSEGSQHAVYACCFVACKGLEECAFSRWQYHVIIAIFQASRVEGLLAEAMEKRTIGCTALNEQSSRSHMVFTMRIEGLNAATGKKISGPQRITFNSFFAATEAGVPHICRRWKLTDIA